MDINLEKINQHSIQAYDHSHVMIGNIQYDQNIVINKSQLIYPWLLDNLALLTIAEIEPLIELHPEVILIGHNTTPSLLPTHVLNELAMRRIGIECTSIGAACRTFNILLSESRNVVLGLIF
jgi:uncharacterized protein